MASFLWTQKQDMGPKPRSNHAIAFDPTSGKTVLFGGANAMRFLNDTWQWDGEYWVQVADTGPAPRHMHALAFDLVEKRIILFGGVGSIDGNVATQTVVLAIHGSGKAKIGLSWMIPGPCLAYCMQ
jgi:hypothetical protein